MECRSESIVSDLPITRVGVEEPAEKLGIAQAHSAGLVVEQLSGSILGLEPDPDVVWAPIGSCPCNKLRLFG